MISALIHPDGHVTPLSGTLSTDPVSVAALAHAVHAAGNELAIRVGVAPVQWVTLRGIRSCLSLLLVEQGVLILEHDDNAPPHQIQALAKSAVAQLAAVSSPQAVAPPPLASSPFSLADALHATAP
ncbi:hypothetical protein [Prosthecobacter debontii]|uniref:hypothetical protein n=1 Tax=Prosthecobacter debontii TaxID=48467 RepID=UPI00099A4E52|nr:hypothetical protein [Prosthecobacter debontii]